MNNKWLAGGVVIIIIMFTAITIIPHKSSNSDSNSKIFKAEASLVQDRQQEEKANPIFQKLPYSGPEFTLTFGYSGAVNNRYSLIAFITVAPGENSDAKIKQEQPSVIKYLQSIGQPNGTYTIQYETQSQ